MKKIVTLIMVFMFSAGLMAEDFKNTVFEYSGPSGLIMLEGTKGAYFKRVDTCNIEAGIVVEVLNTPSDNYAIYKIKDVYKNTYYVYSIDLQKYAKIIKTN